MMAVSMTALIGIALIALIIVGLAIFFLKR